MDNFLALYRGESIEDTKLISLTSDPDIVKDFAVRLLANQKQTNDPVLRVAQAGTDEALRRVAGE